MSQLADSADIVRFSWSGLNRQSARLAASDELADCFSSDLSNYQTIDLICHSHGGNVATRAAWRSRGYVNSIVTLATPYLYSSSHSENRIIEGTINFLFVLLTFASFIGVLTLAPYFPAIFPPNPSEAQSHLFGDLTMLAVVLLTAGISLAAKSGLSRIRDQVEARYSGFGVNTVPVLSLYYRQDEAFRLLGHSTGLHGVVSRITGGIFQSFESLLEGGAIRTTVLLAAPACAFVLAMKGSWWLSIIGALVLFLLPAVAALHVANWFTPIWSGAASLGFDCWKDMLFAGIRIGRTPAGPASVNTCELVFDRSFVGVKSRLAHSDISHDFRAIKASIDWIVARSIAPPAIDLERVVTFIDTE